MITMSKKLMVIPQGGRIKHVTIAGVRTAVLDFNVRRKGKRRVSKETKALQKISRKRIKIPILLAAAIGIGVTDPIKRAMDQPAIRDKISVFFDRLGESYFGFRAGRPFAPEKAVGTGALLIWGGLEGLGIVKRVNRKLGTNNIPFIRL